MKKLILWYNANRKTIWKIIGVIIVVIVVIQLVQYLWKENQKTQNQAIINDIDNTLITNFNTVTLQENKSVVTGEEITQGQRTALETIDDFMQYCNENKVDEAYDLLSEECKNEMYPTVENFKTSYLDTAFGGEEKNVSIENWAGNTYKVKYMNNALATGVYQEEDTIQDYITATTDENGNIKLNINNYIGKQDINKEVEVYGIKVKVIQRDRYMDYETYTFEITNNSDNPILLNDTKNTECMYIEDTNEIKYNAYIHELSEAELKLELKETKTIKIKYYNKYSSTKTIRSIVFSKVILTYNAYSNYQNPGYYKDYGVIQINL